MEGGLPKTDKTEFTDCWRTSLKTPYVMRLALSAGLGGLLFGYDTGVISGALLYIQDDYISVEKQTWLKETIVSMAVAGAIIGAAFGGWMNDKFGRKKSILLADIVFFGGSIVMAAAVGPWMIIVGRVLVGLGVGIASMTAPLYISEASPGTWRWMLGVAGLPALVQFFLMLWLPESPRWLHSQNKKQEARTILEKIYPADQVEKEMIALESTIETEKADAHSIGDGIFSKFISAFSIPIFRRGLYAGIAVQVAQQFVGINTVMYYSPTIVQFAGFASNKTALALSLITSGLNAIGSIVSMAFVDRYGRRRLMLISIIMIIVCLVTLSGVFHGAAARAPHVGKLESAHFGSNSTCSNYIQASNPSSWTCMTCLKASSECAFCAHGANQYHPGACLAVNDATKGACHAEHRIWYSQGCPSNIGFMAVLLLGLYIISFSPGMGSVPWILNSEIYPLKYRGIGCGIAAVANWVSNLIVSESFLSLTHVLGLAGIFLLFAAFSFLGMLAIYLLVPETKGLQFEQVEKMLEKGFRPSLCLGKDKDVETYQKKTSQ